MIRTAHLLSFRLGLVLGFALLIFVLPHRPASAQPSGIDGREPIPILRILERDPGDVYHVPETLPGIQNVPFPRAFAMGDAGVALRTPAAIRLNPAAIGLEQSVEAGFNLGTEPWLSVGAPLVDGWITTASLSIQPNPRWAIGGHFTKQSFGKIDITNDAGVLLRSDEKSQMKAGVSGAYHVTDSWSLGAGLAIVRESFGEASAASLALDLGVRGGWMVDAGSVSLEPSVGWSLVNVGSPLDLGRRKFFTFSDGRKPLPMTMRLGSAVRLASERTWTQHPVLAVTVQAELSKVLAGGEYVPGSSGSRRVRGECQNVRHVGGADEDVGRRVCARGDGSARRGLGADRAARRRRGDGLRHRLAAARPSRRQRNVHERPLHDLRPRPRPGVRPVRLRPHPRRVGHAASHRRHPRRLRPLHSLRRHVLFPSHRPLPAKRGT